VYFTSSRKNKNQTQTQLAQKKILQKAVKMNDKSQESKEPA
jgi:hypothetical protein